MGRLFIFVLVFISQSANAFTYLTLGVGKGEYKLRQDGFFQQHATPHVNNAVSNVTSLGVGHEVKSWLNAEVTFRDLGTWTNYSKFCSDENYVNSRCNVLVNDDWIAYAHGVGETRLVEISAIPKYKIGDFEFSMRIGSAYFWTKYEVSTVYDGQGVQEPMGRIGNPTMTRGVSMVYGPGIAYKVNNGLEILAEYMVFNDISADSTAHDKIQALYISGRIKL